MQTKHNTTEKISDGARILLFFAKIHIYHKV